MQPLFFRALLALLTVALARAQSPGEIDGLAPVSVSSANYRETPRAELLRRARSRNAVNPAPRDLAPLATPKHFVFVRGEVFPADVDYDSLCRMLTAELAKKNYLNAADAQGRIYEPNKVTLVLRVNYGVSLRRNPVVRTEHLYWGEGLVGKIHDARSLTYHGGNALWDNRAGGNDEATTFGERNDANGSSFWGSGGGAGDTSAVVSGDVLGAYDSTRDFNLLVIDAFDYVELKAKQKSASILWTTFVAAPVQRGQKFSQALAAMLRTAAPYWGETTTGLQIFNDSRAEVRIGEAVEVKDQKK